MELYKRLLGFYQPRAHCSLSLQILLSQQQDLSFFTPRFGVENYAFVFLWRQSCEVAPALIWGITDPSKFPTIAGSSSGGSEQTIRCFFMCCALCMVLCFLLSAYPRSSVASHEQMTSASVSQFGILVQQDGVKHLHKGPKSYKPK